MVRSTLVMRVWKTLVFLGTLFFLGQTAFAHAHEIQSLQFRPGVSVLLAGAVFLILGSEWVAGLLWWRVLDFFGQSVPLNWAVETFFKTTLAKYLPGNVWHLVGRVNASRQFNLPMEQVSLSVVIEPLFMVTGGLILSLVFLKSIALQVGALLLVLMLLHPWGIGKLAWGLAWVKQWTRQDSSEAPPLDWQPLSRYPWSEILIGMGFMLLRGGSFCLTLMTLDRIAAVHAPQLISGFSLAWLPAPGGMGVFESSAIQLLNDVTSPAVLLSSVVLFRFLCITTEVLGVGLVLGMPKLMTGVRWIYHSLSAIATPSASEASRVES